MNVFRSIANPRVAVQELFNVTWFEIESKLTYLELLSRTTEENFIVNYRQSSCIGTNSKLV